MSGTECLEQYYITTWKNKAILIESILWFNNKKKAIREQIYGIFAQLLSSEFELLIQRMWGWRTDNVIGNRFWITTNHWPWQLTSWLGYDDTRHCQIKRPFLGWPFNNRKKKRFRTHWPEILAFTLFWSPNLFFDSYGAFANQFCSWKKILFTVWGSLVPCVRNFISIPAFSTFYLNTGAGAAHVRHQRGTFVG